MTLELQLSMHFVLGMKSDRKLVSRVLTERSNQKYVEQIMVRIQYKTGVQWTEQISFASFRSSGREAETFHGGTVSNRIHQPAPSKVTGQSIASQFVQLQATDRWIDQCVILTRNEIAHNQTDTNQSEQSHHFDENHFFFEMDKNRKSTANDENALFRWSLSCVAFACSHHRLCPPVFWALINLRSIDWSAKKSSTFVVVESPSSKHFAHVIPNGWWNWHEIAKWTRNRGTSIPDEFLPHIVFWFISFSASQTTVLFIFFFLLLL